VEDHVIGCAHFDLQVERDIYVTQVTCDVEGSAASLIPLSDNWESFTLREPTLLLLEKIGDVSDFASINEGE
jgi:hypothetical protein